MIQCKKNNGFAAVVFCIELGIQLSMSISLTFRAMRRDVESDDVLALGGLLHVENLYSLGCRSSSAVSAWTACCQCL